LAIKGGSAWEEKLGVIVSSYVPGGVLYIYKLVFREERRKKLFLEEYGGWVLET